MLGRIGASQDVDPNGPAEVLVDHACRIANRNLYESEWQFYVGEEPYATTCPGEG
jgi:hypothetical protein